MILLYFAMKTQQIVECQDIPLTILDTVYIFAEVINGECRQLILNVLDYFKIHGKENITVLY